MMRIIQLLFLTSSVYGVTQLSPRGHGEANPVSDGVGVILGGLGALFGGLGTAAMNLFKDPDDSDQSTTQTPTTDKEGTEPDIESKSSATPSIQPGAVDAHLGIVAEPSTAAPAPATNQKCDPSQPNPESQACKPREEKLVFSKTCKDFNPFEISTDEQMEQCQAVTNRLYAIAGEGNVQVYPSQICAVYMWIVYLTEDEVADLLANTPGIQAIEPNQPASFSSFGTGRRDGRSPIKRTNTPVIQERNAPLHLIFISTPPTPLTPLLARPPKRYFSYDPSAGEGVLVYHFDTDVDGMHNEITRTDLILGKDAHTSTLIVGTLYGAGADPQYQKDYNGFGTCRFSLVGGRRFGVAKKVNAVFVKVAENVGSVLTGMMAIMDNIPKSAPGVTAGRYVISLGLQWQDRETNPEAKASLLHFVRLFTGRDLQIPVVVPLGDDPFGNNEYMDALPSILSSDSIPLITVGAADPIKGTPYPWSKQGDKYSIYAPGMVACADNKERGAMNGVFGSDKSAALVVGLLSYFFGQREIIDQLQGNPSGMAFAMRQFLLEQGSWVRRGSSVPTIWNRNAA